MKTLADCDVSSQPSLDCDRIMALAQLEFIERRQTVHFLGPPGTGKSRLALPDAQQPLVSDEIGYPPSGSNGGNPFFQLVNACYARCAIISTPIRSFGELGTCSATA